MFENVHDVGAQLHFCSAAKGGAWQALAARPFEGLNGNTRTGQKDQKYVDPQKKLVDAQ